VHRAAPSGRPVIQQLEGFPGASNGVGETESNEDRDWPGELSAVHDNLQSELEDGGSVLQVRQFTERVAVGVPW
jgi:hypothetical protein